MSAVIAPLWRISQELEVLLDSLEVCDPELKPELEAKIAEYIGAEVQKVDAIAEVLTTLENVEANARFEIQRLHARQQTAQRSAERLKMYVLRILARRDGRPLKGKNVTLSVRRTEAVVIDDAAAVPEEWKRTTIVTDIPKDPLKKAIKAGQQIPGAHIEQRDNLQRR